MHQAWLDQGWSNAGLRTRQRHQKEGIGIPRGGFETCSQSYSQLVTQSLPSVKLLLVDSSDHSPAPPDRWVAEEGVKGAFVTAKELFPYKSQEDMDMHGVRLR